MPTGDGVSEHPRPQACNIEDDPTVNLLAELSDAELVQRCQELLPADTRAFEALVERHQDQVYATAYRMFGDA